VIHHARHFGLDLTGDVDLHAHDPEEALGGAAKRGSAK
jgi:hypothetical protein